MEQKKVIGLRALVVIGLVIVVSGNAFVLSNIKLRKASRTLYVDAFFGDDDHDGLTPFRSLATLQHAIKVAGNWDRIRVFDGIYREQLDLGGKALTIKGIAGPRGVPVIEAPDATAILMVSGEGPDTVLQNLVIRNSTIGVCTLDSSPTLRNLTVVDCGVGLAALRRSDPVISSCIFWNNAAADISGARAHYSCVERIEEDLLLSNISADPLFVDPVNGDYHLRSRAGYYQVATDTWGTDRYDSPCLNGGDPDQDASVEHAPNGGRVNMGAYAGTAYASLSDNRSPEVLISGQGGSSSGDAMFMSVHAHAEDADGQVIKVEFYVDGMKIGEDIAPEDGWSWQWQVFHEGPYTVIVVAEDDQGLRSLSESRDLEFHGGGGRGR